MKHKRLRFTFIILWFCTFVLPANKVQAQDTWESPRINSNLGATLSVPVNQTAQFVKNSYGVDAGAGYNFSPRHSVIGEFMWNALNPPNGALQPLRAALQDNSISARSNLYAVTGNYRFQLQGKVFGIYAIAGGGWYYRTAALSKQVTSDANPSCEPAWLWWGFTCALGNVVPRQTIGHFNTSALGGNAGIGFTFKVADPSYRLYVESRYHYAPTKNISTKVVDITFGIRY